MKAFMPVIVFAYLLVLSVYADEITLKNGETLTGRLLDQQEDIISFEVHFDSVVFPAIIKKEDVTHVEMDNEDMMDEAALFVLQQKTKGLELFHGRWLPKKHVELIKARQRNINTAQKVALFSIQFFIFLVIAFALVMGVDLLHYQWRKFKLNRIVHQEKADHRLHRRMAMCYPVKVESEKFPLFEAKTTNISLGGLLFATEKDLQLGDQIAVEVILSDSSIEVDGLIVRKEKDIKSDMHNLGVSFLGLNQAKRQQIARLIANSENRVDEPEEKVSDGEGENQDMPVGVLE